MVLIKTNSQSFNKIADYANEKGCTTAYIYGQDDSVNIILHHFQQPLISSSFKTQISVNFEYNDTHQNIFFTKRTKSIFR